MEKLEQLRAKPEHVKRMISAGVAGAITLVIIVFWIASLSVGGGNSSTAVADNASAQIAASPFSTLSASVYDAFAPIAAAFESFVDSIDGKGQTNSPNAIKMYSPQQAAQMNTIPANNQ